MHFDIKTRIPDTTFSEPDYRSETDVEIAFFKEEVEVFSLLKALIAFKVIWTLAVRES